ncbi:hypothetical protein Tco_0231801 [Tanacetum coccineum]
MFSMASWNIRGLNRAPKQNEVCQVVKDNHLNICAILESHVDVSCLNNICTRVFTRWMWTSNGFLCNKGSRIILGWDPDHVDIMIEKWVDGNKMFQIVSKLKSLKSPFRKLLKDQGNLHLRVECLKTELDEAQKALDYDPSNSILCEEEAIYLKAFNQAILDEELKNRVQKNRIEVVCDMDNIEYEGLSVPNAFVKHYEMFLGVESATTPLDIPNLFTKNLPSDIRDQMVCLITNDEIKKAMFSIGDNRSQRPDASVLWEALEEFKEASGLIPKGKIPVKYLGVPLISSRLLYKDCKILVENVHNKIGEMKKGKAKDKVVDVMHNGEWSWEADWLDIQPPLLDPNKDDMLFWRDNNGNLKPFSSYVRKYAAMEHIDSRMANIISWLYPLLSTNSARSICSRLVVAASAYYIWQERNNLIFRKKARNVKQVRDTIIATIRLKIISLRFKKSLKVAKALEVWKISTETNSDGNG